MGKAHILGDRHANAYNQFVMMSTTPAAAYGSSTEDVYCLRAQEKKPRTINKNYNKNKRNQLALRFTSTAAHPLFLSCCVPKPPVEDVGISGGNAGTSAGHACGPFDPYLNGDSNTSTASWPTVIPVVTDRSALLTPLRASTSWTAPLVCRHAGLSRSMGKQLPRT